MKNISLSCIFHIDPVSDKSFRDYILDPFKALPLTYSFEDGIDILIFISKTEIDFDFPHQGLHDLTIGDIIISEIRKDGLDDIRKSLFFLFRALRTLFQLALKL